MAHTLGYCLLVSLNCVCAGSAPVGVDYFFKKHRVRSFVTGYKQEKPEDFSDLYSLAKIGSKALQTVNGVDYMIGAIPDLLYVASGK